MNRSLFMTRRAAILIFCLFYSPAFTQEDFLYSQEIKIPLSISTEKISIKFKSGITQAQIDSLLLSEPVLSERKSLEPAVTKDFFTVSLKSRTDVKQLVQRLKRKPEVDIVNPVYMLEGLEAIPFDHFVVQFKPSVTPAQIEALNRQHNVEIVSVSTAAHNLYTFRVTAASDYSVLDMANLYYESLPCEWSLPDFIVPGELFYTPNDTYFQNQYYFHNTGQTGGVTDADIDAPEAWDISTGSSSIVIAVIDEGGAAHEDLPSNRIVAGYDYFDIDNDPSPGGNEAHGMASAGIIAASQNNNLGIAGLAPGCKIMPIRIFNHKGVLTTVNNVAAAVDFAWQNGAHVLSNSWGYFTPDPNNPLYVPVRDAINRALTQGRGGKGCVVVAAAGNTANRSGENYGYVAFPANVSGVLAVGATDKSNNIQNYSPRDSELGVVAPSGATSSCIGGDCFLSGDVWSMDISGEPGWNPGDYGIDPPTEYIWYMWDPPGGDAYPPGNYTAKFGGTSAACPQVAGLAALTLSLNPNLEGKPTNPQVQTIIKQTADDMGSSGYDTDFGYGRINAYQALLLTHAYSNKSVSSTATAYNNGRRIVRDEGNNRYHLVFESGGEIFYRRSNQGGTSWEDPVRLTTGNGSNKYPSIVFNSGKLFVVWQRNTSGNNYTIYFRGNPGSGWGSTLSLGTVSFSSPNNPLPVLTVKEVRVTGGTRKIRLVACWKSSSSITYRYSDNDGGSWATAASLPSTTSNHQSPSLSPGAFFDYSYLDIYATCDNPTYAVYLNKYHTDLTSNTTTWGSPEVVPASSATGPRFSQVTSGDYPEPSPNVYVVWQGFDPVEQMEAVYYQGKVSGGWTASNAYVNSSYQRPTITNLSSGNLAMLWDNRSNVYKATYSGSPKSWSSSQLVGPGFNVNPSISFGIGNPPSSAKYTWTSGAAAPYQIQVSSEILQKPAVLESEYHRRITVADSVGAVFLVDFGEIYVETIGGLASSLEFVGVNDTLISLTDENLWTHLQTKPIVLLLDVDTLVVEKAVYSQNAERLAEQRSSGITVTFDWRMQPPATRLRESGTKL